VTPETLLDDVASAEGPAAAAAALPGSAGSTSMGSAVTEVIVVVPVAVAGLEMEIVPVMTVMVCAAGTVIVSAAGTVMYSTIGMVRGTLVPAAVVAAEIVMTLPVPVTDPAVTIVAPAGMPAPLIGVPTLSAVEMAVVPVPPARLDTMSVELPDVNVAVGAEAVGVIWFAMVVLPAVAGAEIVIVSVAVLTVPVVSFVMEAPVGMPYPEIGWPTTRPVKDDTPVMTLLPACTMPVMVPLVCPVATFDIVAVVPVVRRVVPAGIPVPVTGKPTSPATGAVDIPVMVFNPVETTPVGVDEA